MKGDNFFRHTHGVSDAGYAVTTILIRLSLTAFVYYNVAIVLFSVIFALLFTIIHDQFHRDYPQGNLH